MSCGHNILYQMARVDRLELSELSLDYCCHVSLSRVNGYRDDLDQGNWHVSNNNVEVGFQIRKPRYILTKYSPWTWKSVERPSFLLESESRLIATTSAT